MNVSRETRAMLAAILFGASAVFAGSALASMPRQGKSIAVLTWPGPSTTSAVDVIINADGVIKDFGRFSWIAVSDNDNETRVSRLYKAGALLVLDASIVATCLGL